MMANSKIYINGQYNNGQNDEATTRKDAKYLLGEYSLAYGSGWNIWMSSRPCKNWR